MDLAHLGKKGAAASERAEAEKEKSPRKAVSIVAKAIEDSDDDGWVNRAKVGSRILGEALGFDPRMYGCPNRSTLVAKTGGFEVRKEPGKSVFIRRKATGRKASSRVSGVA